MTIQNKSTTAQYGSGEVKPSYPEGAALRQVYDALCQAQDCIRGETPEDISDEAAREDTIDKIRDAMRAIEAMQSRGVAQAPITTEDIRGAVARGWCYEANRNKEMDSNLAEAISMEIGYLLMGLALSSTDRP